MDSSLFTAWHCIRDFDLCTGFLSQGLNVLTSLHHEQSICAAADPQRRHTLPMMLPAREAGTRIRRDTSIPTEQRLSVPSTMGAGSLFSFLRDILICQLVNLAKLKHKRVGMRSLNQAQAPQGRCSPSNGGLDGGRWDLTLTAGDVCLNALRGSGD